MKGARSDHSCIWCTIHKKNKLFILYISFHQGRKCGGVWGGGSPPQRNDPVGLKLRAVGLKLCVCLHAVLCEAN